MKGHSTLCEAGCFRVMKVTPVDFMDQGQLLQITCFLGRKQCYVEYLSKKTVFHNSMDGGFGKVCGWGKQASLSPVMGVWSACCRGAAVPPGSGTMSGTR